MEVHDVSHEMLHSFLLEGLLIDLVKMQSAKDKFGTLTGPEKVMTAELGIITTPPKVPTLS